MTPQKTCHIFVLCQHGCRRYSHLRWLGIFLVNPIGCFRTKKNFLCIHKLHKKDAILQMFEQGIYVCKKKRKKIKMFLHLHGPLKPSAHRSAGARPACRPSGLLLTPQKKNLGYCHLGPACRPPLSLTCGSQMSASSSSSTAAPSSINPRRPCNQLPSPRETSLPLESNRNRVEQ